MLKKISFLCFISLLIYSNDKDNNIDNNKILAEAEDNYIKQISIFFAQNNHERALKFVNDCREANKDNTPFITIAVLNQWVDLFNLLRRIQGLDINQKDKYGWTAQQYAKHNKFDQFKFD